MCVGKAVNLAMTSDAPLKRFWKPGEHSRGGEIRQEIADTELRSVVRQIKMG
jgi:hypothetical protein